MCVIIVKPAGIRMPSKDTLKMAYLANPHGCGFASTNHAFKSLSYAEFLDRLAEVGDDEACIIHFRLATHGSIRRSNCHPFEKGGIYFAHNGVLDIKPDGDMTDSETAFLRIIHPVAKKYGIGSRETAEAVRRIIGFSKFAMMESGSYEIKTFGRFIADDDGCMYSNFRFAYGRTRAKSAIS